MVVNWITYVASYGENYTPKDALQILYEGYI